MSEIRGVDLSSWQSELKDGAVLKKAGTSFAILKVTEGRTVKDKAFTAHYNMCREAGIPTGAYVYSHAIGAEGGRAEADFALAQLNGRSLELPVYLDVESGTMLASGKEQIMAAIRAFGQAVKAAGYRAGVYASKWVYDVYINYAALKAEGFSIWCAAYNITGAGMPCDIWQHTDKGRITGYSGNLDFNILYNGALLGGAEPAPENAFWPPRTIDLGMSGADVGLWQAVMRAKGYECEITEEFDERTRLATIEFQTEAGITPDGIPGPVSWAAALKY